MAAANVVVMLAVVGITASAIVKKVNNIWLRGNFVYSVRLLYAL
jgi:hypothetical protein